MKCKIHGGIKWYQDSQDHRAISNLKTHAMKCHGWDAVEAAFQGEDVKAKGRTIFAHFACIGQASVKFSHKAHLSAEIWYISLSYV